MKRRVDLDAALAHAALGVDILPHMPDFDLERCEFCNRPDWEAPGNCLARVRKSANKLGGLAVALEALSDREWAKDSRAPEVLELRRALGEALDMLREVGVTAKAHREWTEEQRRLRLERRHVTGRAPPTADKA